MPMVLAAPGRKRMYSNTGIEMFAAHLEERTGVTRLAIFDLDGTLVDSREDLWRAVNHALAAVGLPGAVAVQVWIALLLLRAKG